jgi:23S rRNA (cytidine1920-2'-O)/16S rRNA (cytidine1409-2'-O)-methyltransferase
MPRLDVWLTEQKLFSSRQMAKRAIRDGGVTVDGKLAKPSTWISGKEEILVNDRASNAPQGYSKLMAIESALDIQFVRPGILALDIGSSAGGFLTYLAEKGAKVTGLEFSQEFSIQLKEISETYPDVSVLLCDAFDVDPMIICGPNELDLLLVDVTTNPDSTITLTKRFTPLLKRGGMIVVAMKIKPASEELHVLQDKLTELGYRDIQKIVLDQSRQEVHLIAIHR